MKIQILGPGCAKCKKLEENAHEALVKSGLPGEIEKITDLDQIMEMGVMFTPALALDGQVKASGKILSVDEILKLLKAG